MMDDGQIIKDREEGELGASSGGWGGDRLEKDRPICHMKRRGRASL